jgi:hypothetical protein
LQTKNSLTGEVWFTEDRNPNWGTFLESSYEGLFHYFHLELLTSLVRNSDMYISLNLFLISRIGFLLSIIQISVSTKSIFDIHNSMCAIFRGLWYKTWFAQYVAGIETTLLFIRDPSILIQAGSIQPLGGVRKKPLAAFQRKQRIDQQPPERSIISLTGQLWFTEDEIISNWRTWIVRAMC